MAVAASAGSIAVQLQNSGGSSFCDASNINQIGKSIGGKDSTGYLVKGSHTKVPQELIDELKAICQDNMTMDYDDRYSYGKPPNSFHKAANVPVVVVFPRYDLTCLMIGSEGTLGVITEVTLRLQKIPQHSVVAICNFPTIKDAADVAIATMLSGIQYLEKELGIENLRIMERIKDALDPNGIMNPGKLIPPHVCL